MKSRWIIGGGTFLQVAFLAWKGARPDDSLHCFDVPQAADYAFDMGIFSKLDPLHDAVFIAFDERFGNFKRMELVQGALDHGLRLEPFISPRAMVGQDVKIGPNAFIADGTIVGALSSIDHNTVIGPGCQLGFGVHIRASCWLEAGVQLGDQAQLGAHTTIRSGVLVAPRVRIGRNCEIAVPGVYRTDVLPRTVFDPRYDEPIYVYGK